MSSWRDDIKFVRRGDWNVDIVLGGYFWDHVLKQWVIEREVDSLVGAYRMEVAETLALHIPNPPPGYQKESQVSDPVRWRDNLKIVPRIDGNYDVMLGNYEWSRLAGGWLLETSNSMTCGRYDRSTAEKLCRDIPTAPPGYQEAVKMSNVVNWRDNIKMVRRENHRYDITLGDYWWSPVRMTWVDSKYADNTIGIYDSLGDAIDAAQEITSPPHGYKEVTEMNNAVSFKVGDTGKTQGGATYRIVAIINNPDFPIIAIVRDHNSDIEQSCRFRLNGVPPTYSPNSYYQLLPPTVTKYVNLYQRYRDDIKTVVFDTPEQAQGHADSYPTESTKVLKVAVPVEIGG